MKKVYVMQARPLTLGVSACDSPERSCSSPFRRVLGLVDRLYLAQAEEASCACCLPSDASICKRYRI